MTRTDIAAPPHAAHPRVPSYGGGGELHLALAMPSIAIAWSAGLIPRAHDAASGEDARTRFARDVRVMDAVAELLAACDVSYLCV